MTGFCRVDPTDHAPAPMVGRGVYLAMEVETIGRDDWWGGTRAGSSGGRISPTPEPRRIVGERPTQAKGGRIVGAGRTLDRCAPPVTPLHLGLTVPDHMARLPHSLLTDEQWLALFG